MAKLPSVQVSERPDEKFEEFLEMHGHRKTKGRRELVRHIFSYHDHFTAEDLVLDVERRKIRVSRSSIYRTLSLLVEAGLLRKLRFGDRDAYEHDYGYPEHDHLYCTKCGKILEFYAGELEQLRDRVAREHRFRATSHRFIIAGLCDSCSRSSAAVRKLDFV